MLSFLTEVNWPGNNMAVLVLENNSGTTLGKRCQHFPRRALEGPSTEHCPQNESTLQGSAVLCQPCSPHPPLVWTSGSGKKDKKDPRRRLHFPPQRGAREALSFWGCLWTSAVGWSPMPTDFVEVTFGNIHVIPEVCRAVR